MASLDDDPRLPLKLWPCSNGEYLPPPLDELRRESMRLAHDAADDHARRHGWSRRQFLTSSVGLASGLLALESAAGQRARALGIERGGRFAVSPSVAGDVAEADNVVHAGTPVVDVQTHFLENVGSSFGSGFPQASCGEADPADCFSVDYWYDLVFGGSDTAVAVISAVPVVGDADPLSIDAMERGRDLARQLCGDGRVLVQGHAVPDVGPPEAALAAMADVAAHHELSAWKVYTHAPSGWSLDDHDPDAPALGARVHRDRALHRGARHRRAQGIVGAEPLRLTGRRRPGRRREPRHRVPRVPLRLRDRQSPRAPTTPTAAGSTGSCAASPRPGWHRGRTSTPSWVRRGAP